MMSVFRELETDNVGKDKSGLKTERIYHTIKLLYQERVHEPHKESYLCTTL